MIREHCLPANTNNWLSVCITKNAFQERETEGKSEIYSIHTLKVIVIVKCFDEGFGQSWRKGVDIGIRIMDINNDHI